MNAAFLAANTGHPAQAERWADAVDRWQHQNDSQPPDPYTEAMAATLRAISCRRGAEQMRADADEAAQKFAAAKFAVAVTPLLQGTARVLCGDLDGADAFFAEAASIEEERQVPEVIAVTLCERSLVAMARNQWNQAEALASRAHAHLRRAGSRTPSLPPSPARCRLVSPSTAETSQRHAGTSSAPSGCGL